MDVDDDHSVNDALQKLVAQSGRIDVVINNAGFGIAGAIEDTTADEATAQLATNFIGTHRVCRAVLPLMRAQGGGAIVNVSSNTTRMVIPGIGPYSATKCALNQLSATARAEWAADGVVVSVVHPSVTATEFHQTLRAGSMRGGGRLVPEAPEVVARAILEAIRSGAAEVVVPPKQT